MKLLTYYAGERFLETERLADMFVVARIADEKTVNFDSEILFGKQRGQHFVIGKPYVVKRKGRKGNYGYLVTADSLKEDAPPISKKIIQKWSAMAASAKTVAQTSLAAKKIRNEHANAWKDCLSPLRRAYLGASSWRERKALLIEVQAIITGQA